MTSLVYAENLTLKGSFYVGTKYVPASFKLTGNDKVLYNIIFKEYDEMALKIINKLVNVCSGNDGQECEIVANVNKLSDDDIAYGDITYITYINGLNTDNLEDKVDNNFVNKYNECLKSSKKLLDISEKSISLITKAESILNKDEMDKLRNDFKITSSIKDNNQAEQMSKDRNISLCDAYIELKQDFIDMTESYLNQKISENDKLKPNNFVDCSRFRFAMNGSRWIDGSYDKTYYYPENMNLQKVIINDKFDVPLAGTKQANDNQMNRLPFFYNSPPNIFTIYNITSEFDKISIYDSNGNICVIGKIRPY